MLSEQRSFLSQQLRAFESGDVRFGPMSLALETIESLGNPPRLFEEAHQAIVRGFRSRIERLSLLAEQASDPRERAFVGFHIQRYQAVVTGLEAHRCTHVLDSPFSGLTIPGLPKENSSSTRWSWIKETVRSK